MTTDLHRHRSEETPEERGYYWMEEIVDGDPLPPLMRLVRDKGGTMMAGKAGVRAKDMNAFWTGPIPRPEAMVEEAERPDKNGHAHVWASDGDLVATVCDAPVHGETAYDRARLIAAAPDLLSAAGRMLGAAQPSDPAEPGAQRPDQGAVQELQDALDAARGG